MKLRNFLCNHTHLKLPGVNALCAQPQAFPDGVETSGSSESSQGLVPRGCPLENGL